METNQSHDPTQMGMEEDKLPVLEVQEVRSVMDSNDPAEFGMEEAEFLKLKKDLNESLTRSLSEPHRLEILPNPAIESIENE